jgi:hypothetical protein
MAQTRYSDLRDAFHVSRFTNNGLLRQADFFSILLDDRHRLDDHRLSVPPALVSSAHSDLSTRHFPELVFLRIDGMEPRRMTGR